MGPIRGQSRPLPVTAEIAPETQRIDTKLNASIHNRFDIEVINAETGKVRQRAQAENVICNNLWTYMFNTSSNDHDWNRYIQYGSGSGTPSAADTSLFAYSGYGTPSTGTLTNVYSYDGVNAVYSLKRKIVLSETTAVGVTITEMGIAKSTSDSLCTHAMLKDMNGNQISIAKTATDIINIYSTVFCHFGGEYRKYFAFGANSMLLNYAVGMNSLGQGLFSNPYLYGASGSSDAIFTPTATHTAATKTLKCTFKRCGVNDGNYSGLLALVDNETTGNVMYVDSAWFAGSSVVSESIGTGDGVKKDFKTIFGFVKSGAKVYVDGVLSSAVVDVGTPTVVSSLSVYCRNVDNQGNLILGAPGSFSLDGTPSIFYNPNYAYGFTQIACKESGYSAKIEASDDLVNWTTAISNLGSTSVSIPSNLKNSKYWKVTKLGGTYSVILTITSSELSGNNIHFSEAPASGAIITSDYDTAMIAKDANHVFDVSVTVQFGEHTA